MIVPAFPAHADTFHAKSVNPPQLVPPLVYEDAAGKQHTLAEQRGHFVLLNIWASWCVPCVGEMPSLDALQKEFAPGQLTVISLSEDRGAAGVSAFYKTHSIAHLPVAIDRGGIAPSALHLQGLPTTLLIDPQGREVARVEGDEDWHAAAALDFLKSFTGQNRP